jgi:hypothetical protein
VSPNRFERMAAWVKTHRVAAIAFLLMVVVAADSAAAWTYLFKRRLTQYPIVDLLEQYYVLEPFRRFFPDQYLFPPVLLNQLKGETSSAAATRQFWVSDPILGHRLAQNALVLEETWTWRATNAQGFIITDAVDPLHVYAQPKPKGVYRIIMLGGSTLEGDGATGSLTALPAQLLERLRANYAPADSSSDVFEIINAGVGGYTSEQEMLYFMSELRFFQPDLVIAYDGWNDETVLNEEMSRSGTQYPWLRNQSTEQQRQILTGYFDWSSTASAFVQRSATRALEILDGVAIFHMSKRTLKLLAARLKSTDNTPATESTALYFSPESVTRYLENETMIAQMANDLGAHAAWFMQPLVGLGNKPPAAFREINYIREWQDKISRRKQFYAMAEEGQGRIARKFGSPTKLCAGVLTDVFDGNPDGVYEDFGHLFDNGNEIVAERIARELAQCGLIQAKDSTANP